MKDRRSGASDPLRPVRWPAGPRRSTVLRATLVALLLALAAGVLYAYRAPACAPGGVAGASAGPSAPGPTARGMPTLPAGAVGVPVRLAEPAGLAVVRPGARVDLLAVPPAGSTEPVLVASRALVLDVLGGGATDEAGALYLALRPEQAERTISLPEGSRFAIVVRA